jgi:hypothetical protein
MLIGTLQAPQGVLGLATHSVRAYQMVDHIVNIEQPLNVRKPKELLVAMSKYTGRPTTSTSSPATFFAAPPKRGERPAVPVDNMQRRWLRRPTGSWRCISCSSSSSMTWQLVAAGDQGNKLRRRRRHEEGKGRH